MPIRDRAGSVRRHSAAYCVSATKVWASVCAALVVACVLSVGTAGCRKTRRVQLTISVAASLTGTIEPLEADYQRTHPQVEFRNNFGGSGMLARQIEQGAPVDLFLSAAAGPVNELVAKGLVGPRQSHILLRNTLVLIAPRDSQLGSIEQLASREVRRVAIGDPASVPAGQYGMQTLAAAGLAESVRDKLVFSKDVRQVLAYVETGNVDAGFVYATDAAQSARVRVVATAPEASHDPIVYPIAVLAQSPHASEAGQFAAFLASAEAARVFASRGFTVSSY